MSNPVATPDPAPSQSRPLYRDFTVLQGALLVFLLDQFTKYVVIQNLAPGFSFPFRGFFRITHVHNTGSAFGILQGLNTPLIFVSFVGIVILVLIYRSQPHPSNWLRLSLALQLGGAFGNLVDRVHLGYVTDFIDIGPWPVFNLADSSIVIGLILLAWVLTRGDSSKSRAEAPGNAPPNHKGEPEEKSARLLTGVGLEDRDSTENLVLPMRESAEGKASDPVVDLIRRKQRETLSASPEETDGRNDDRNNEAERL